MKTFYNEIDPYCCAWLDNLMTAGVIERGTICNKPVQELALEDVRGYDRCHFFAGIAGWELALRLAGWAADRPVWTGSCPCQPFSVAGKRKAQSDERHLWPAWFSLIKSVKPPVVFGEQVAGAIAHGWWDDAANDLESEGYETGAAILPACSVGAPHKRDRLWFVANGKGDGRHEGKPHAAKGNKTFADTDTVWESQSERSVEEQRRRISDCGEGRYANWDSESGVCRLANGIPARVGKLRAFGNAIVPMVAAEFIKAHMNA
jgi:DNA (cytosine-5)-methyltransferase 1